MSDDSLLEIANAEQAAVVEPDSTPSAPSDPSDLSSGGDVEPTIEPSEPQVDDFIREASEATGMDLSQYGSKEKFLASYAELRKKISERDELANLGKNILSSPFAPKVLELLQGKAQEPVPPAALPAGKSNEPPEWDPSWDAIVHGENPPAELVAKFHKRQAWAKQRAESLITSEALQQLASNPQDYIRTLIEPLIGDLRKSQQETAAQIAEREAAAQVKTMITPVEKEIFTGTYGDWNSVSPFGKQVLDMYHSEPGFVQADPVRWLNRCIQTLKQQVPQPKTPKPAPNAATRQPAVGAPPVDPMAAEKALEEALEKEPNMPVGQIQALMNKLLGQAG